MQIEQTYLKDAFIIHPDVYKDERGWFTESYSISSFPLDDVVFIQNNHSYSAKKGVIRGLHIQNAPYTQSKLIRCIRGAINDVIVDVRPSSPTYLKHIVVLLSQDNMNELFIPKGFLHGFVTLTDDVEVCYKVDAVYNKNSERSVLFSDSLFNINWGEGEFTLSAKDKAAPLFSNADIVLED